MQYGSVSINDEKLYLFQGFDPNTVITPPKKNLGFVSHMGVVNQRDADLHFLWQMVYIYTSVHMSILLINGAILSLFNGP